LLPTLCYSQKNHAGAYGLYIPISYPWLHQPRQAAKRWSDAWPPNITEVNLSIARIIRDAYAADELIQHIRALFKQEPVVKKEASVRDLVKEAVRLVQEDPNKREVPIDWRFDANLPKVPVDHISIQEVFINLISNAIEAVQNTRISPLIKVRASVTGQNEMVIEVIDNGPGVNDPEEIFDAFVTTKATAWGSVWPCRARLSRRMAAGFGLRMVQMAVLGSM
jgi:signal transduction histidine kinase